MFDETHQEERRGKKKEKFKHLFEFIPSVSVFFLFFLAIVLIITLSQNKTRELDAELLDLPFIVNEVDRIGGEETQLNWKEIISVLTVLKDNVGMDQITTEELETTASLFFNEEGKLLSFEEMLEKEGWENKTKELAAYYLESLTYAGYTPEKIQPEANEVIFIEHLIKPAKENYHKSGILPSITIAQAILESNWGESQLTKEANNLFGIKVGVGWEGETYIIKTLENFDEYIEDSFRKYDTLQDSIDDHANFLIENPRYQEAGVFNSKTYRAQAQALQDAGYSTAQDEAGNYVYAQRLGEIIRQYNLQLIDHEVLSEN